MTFRPLLALAALGLLSTSASAQLHTVVGPPVVPIGGDLSITFSNDYPGKFGVTSNLWRILDAAGNEVFAPGGAQFSLLMGSGGWFNFRWNLKDQGGGTVPPGHYRLEVQYDFFAPVDVFPFSVSNGGAGLVFEGRATTSPVFGGGTGRNFYLTSPADAGMTYMLLASISNTAGTATCGGTVPLDITPLLLKSLEPNTVFQNSFGTLNAKGESTAPRFDLPPIPALVGISLESAFLVLDPASPCIIRRISNAHSMTIL